MKTVFVINPMAGKKNNIEKLKSTITKTALKLGKEAEIYLTKGVSDATDFVKNYCKTYGAARFIAVGGDGTLSEVLNGVMETEGSEVGVIPVGTGNDFCRNFDIDCEFDNISLQLQGESVRCDAIRYKTVVDGVAKSGYCANMFNIGFDCNVADTTQRIKKDTFLSGSLAYFTSIFVSLVKRKCTHLEIELDGKKEHEGELLLTSLANGCFCGGGIKSNPLASVSDGNININIIKKVPRLKFVSLLPYYMKGTVLELKGVEKYITSKLAKKITVTPLAGKMIICIDGEISDAEKTEFEVVHNAFNFVLPKESKSFARMTNGKD